MNKRNRLKIWRKVLRNDPNKLEETLDDYTPTAGQSVTAVHIVLDVIEAAMLNEGIR